MPEPFAINIPEREIEDLQDRLARARWPDAITGAGWSQGTDLAFLEQLMRHWQHDYDWRTHEKALNAFSHFRAPVDGLGIHFIHERGKGPNPMPLLLGHGCFSNFYEFHKVIRSLSDPASSGGDPNDAFDVVAWSLPGFGFSDKPQEAGFGTARMAEVAHRLMTDTLGYSRYGACGGSWSGQIATRLGYSHADAIIGLHLTQANPPARPEETPGSPPLSDAEHELIRITSEFRKEETGYLALLTTRPQSLAYALADSPTGLAGWVVEKLRAWSDCHGDLGSTFTLEEVLTSISITWFTNTVASGQRLYYEMLHGDWAPGPGEMITVPTGVLALPGGIPNETSPPETIRRRFNLQHYRMSPAGGHYPALEIPRILTEEIRTFFRPLRQE
jgi:pimeloyl-ACP methyl ester carboxylesterase